MQITDDENASCLAFERNGRFAFSDCLHGDELQFTDAYSRPAYRLQDQTKTLILLSLRCPAQPLVFCLRHLLFFRAEDLLLNFQRFHPQLVPAEKRKQTVYACQHRIDTSHGVPAVYQILLISDNGIFCNRPVAERRKRRHITDILFHRIHALFLLPQVITEFFDFFVC